MFGGRFTARERRLMWALLVGVLVGLLEALLEHRWDESLGFVVTGLLVCRLLGASAWYRARDRERLAHDERQLERWQLVADLAGGRVSGDEATARAAAVGVHVQITARSQGFVDGIRRVGRAGLWQRPEVTPIHDRLVAEGVPPIAKAEPATLRGGPFGGR